MFIIINISKIIDSILAHRKFNEELRENRHRRKVEAYSKINGFTHAAVAELAAALCLVCCLRNAFHKELWW